MAWPTDFGTIPANAQGNTLVADIADDHALAHRQIGSILNSAGSKLGLSAGTPAVNQILTGGGNGSAAWGTSGTLLNFASSNFNNGNLGTNLYQGGTYNNGVLGTPTITGGTAKGIQITTSTLGSVAISPGTSTTGTLDLSLGNRFLVNMPNAAGSVALAVINPTANQLFIIEVLQAASGLGTINWFSTVRWAGSSSPVQTTTASRKDTFGFITTGTTPTFDGYIVGQNL